MSFVMADFYKRFVDEELDSEGRLKSFKLDLPENFNFSYDVIDELAKNVPDKVAMQWVNEEGEEHIFTYKDLSEKSSQVHTELRRAILLWLFLNVIMSSGSLLTVL